MGDPLDNFIAKINEQIINPLLALLFAVALAYFFWGLMKFVQASESDEARTVGRRHMLWGVIGMFLMSAVFLLLRFVLATFGIDPSDTSLVPAGLPL